MYAVVTRLKRKDGQDCYLVYEEGFDTEEAAAKKKAAELLSAIEGVLDGRDDYVVEIQQ